MKKRTDEKPHHKWRWLHALWAVPLALLLVQNILLWTPAARWLMEKVKVVRFDYKFAYSIVPGHLTLYDARLIVSDRAVQMQIDARRVELVVDFDSIRKKMLHLSTLKGDGVRLRFRPVLTAEQANAPWVQLCPPIEGEPMPPMWRHPEWPKPPTEKLLKFHFEGIDARFEELWLGPMRLQGKGHIQGGFLLHPRTRLGVSPAQVSFSTGTRLSLGEVVLGEDITLALSGELPPTDFARPPSQEKTSSPSPLSAPSPLLSALRAHVDTNIAFNSFAALEPLIPATLPRLSSSSGQLVLRAGLNQGKLEPDFSFQLDSSRLGVTATQFDPALTMKGPLAIRARSKDGKHMSARMDFSHVLFSYVQATDPPTKAKSPQLNHLLVEVDVTFDSQLTDPKFTGGRALIKELDLPELSFFNKLLKDTPLAILGGAGQVNAEIEIPANLSAVGQVQAKLNNVALRADQVRADFSAALQGQLKQNLNTGRVSIQPVTLIVQPLHVHLDEQRIPWSFRLTTGHTTIDAKTGDKVSDLALHGPTLQPFLDALIKNGLLRSAGKLLVAKGDTEARVRFTQSKTTSRLDLLSFKSGGLAVDGVLMSKHEQLMGAFLLIGSVVRVGIVVPPGKPRVHPTASRRWLEEELARQGIAKVEHEFVKPGTNKDKEPTR